MEAAVPPLVMKFMPVRATIYLGQDSVHGPRQIQARMCLREQVGHQHVVEEPAELVLGQAAEKGQVLHHDISQYLQEGIFQGLVYHKLHPQEASSTNRMHFELMMGLVLVPRIGKLVHGKVNPVEDEIVHSDAKPKLREEPKGGWGIARDTRRRPHTVEQPHASHVHWKGGVDPAEGS